MSERRKVLELFEEQKESMQERIAAGIEQYRKGNACIRIKDKDGNCIPDAKITINQKTHEFKFGANIFMLDELETEEKNEKYKKYFSELFNIATLPFYWKDNEPTEGNYRFSKDSERIYRRPAIDLCLEFCEQHGIEPRAHCLNYENWSPDWVIDETVDVIKEKLETRMKVLAERYADKIHGWEVTNETIFNLPDRKYSVFYHEPDFNEWSFKTAEKYFKNNELIINDADCNIWSRSFNYNRSAYYMIIERALRKKSRIDAIGMQFHMFFNKEVEKESTFLFYDPSHLFAVMDAYAEFNKPMHITEITIPAYSNETEDEEIQAEILKNLYSIWFSHPNMEQIIYWNLVDGYAAFAPQGDMTAGENYYYGGLLRFDLTPKPAYFMLKDLIQKQWHTELVGKTDGNGCVEFKGFYGDYVVDISVGTGNCRKTFTLSSKCSNDICIEI